MEYFKKWNTSKNGLLNKSNYGKKSNYGTVRVTTVRVTTVGTVRVTMSLIKYRRTKIFFFD